MPIRRRRKRNFSARNRAVQEWIGQELRAHYELPPGLPHRILTILIQIAEWETVTEKTRQVQLEKHVQVEKYGLPGGFGGVARSPGAPPCSCLAKATEN
jgi:hypothetical protein